MSKRESLGGLPVGLFAEYFPAPRPARTTIVTDLVVPGLLVEIQVTAGIPGDDEAGG